MRVPSFIAAALAATLLPAVAAPWTLEQALERAEQHSQSIRAARSGVAGAVEMARAAGRLPDPVLRAGVENLPVTGADRYSSTRDFMTMKRIGLSQEWRSAEKQSARHAAAQAMTGRAAVAVRAAAAETRLQTALAYVDARHAEEVLALGALTERRVREELAAARARLASASAGSAEVLALTAAQGLAEDESAGLHQQHSAARIALERWVGVAVDALAPVAPAAGLPEAEYVAASPAVVALEHDAEIARRDAAVAASERHPDWTWEVAYAQRSGYSDMLSFGVSIPLQVDRAERQDRETTARLVKVDQVEAELAEARRVAGAEYRALAIDVERLRQRIERWRTGVLAPAQQRPIAALAAYRSNQGALAGVFEARQAEVDVQRKLLELQRDLARAQVRLAYKPLGTGSTP